MWKKKKTDEAEAPSEEAMIDAIHRVVKSNAPDAYDYLCEIMPPPKAD